MAQLMSGRSVRRCLAVVVMIGTGIAVGAAPASAGPPNEATLTIRKVATGADGNFEFTVIDNETEEELTDNIQTINGVAENEIVVDLPAGNYTVEEELNTAFETSVSCDSGEQADDLTLAPGDDVICTFTNRATLALSKTITSVAVVQGQTGQYDVAYRVTATNTLTVERGVELQDLFFLPDTVTPVGAATLSNLVNIDTPATGWTGFSDDFSLVGETVLEAGQSASFDVSVRLAVAANATAADRDCVGINEFGTGSLNVVLATVARGEAIAVACSPLSSLTLVAQVVNDNGGTLVPSSITLSALNATTTAFSGNGTVRGWIGVAPLTIAGADVANYTRSVFTCTGGTLAGTAVTVAPGTDATCTIVYNDIAVAATTTTTTTVGATTVASTLPPTGSGRATAGSAGLAVALLGAGGLLLLLTGVRRRATRA